MEQDLLDLLVMDHRRIESLLAEVETLHEPDARHRALDEVLAAVARHAVVERDHLYPVLRDSLPAGPVLADHEAGEHADTDRLLLRLDRLDEHGAEHAALLAELMTTVRLHVQEQETELFPRLRQACAPEELGRLGALLRADR